MANIITVLFEQIIAKNIEKVNARQSRDSRISKSNFQASFVLNVHRLDDEQNETNIFFNNEVTKYDFFETVYQITNVLGQTNPCLISSLIMIDRFSVKNPNFTITQDNIQRYVTPSFILSYNLYRLLIVAVSATCKMHDDFYFTNKSWCQLAGMDVRSYSQMESVFIQMVDFDFIISSSYYNKY